MAENLPASRKTGLTHLSAERVEHREWIGGRVLTLLSHYWREDDPVELTAAIGRDWADVLEGLPQEYIQRACIQYMRDEPRRKPGPGAIYSIAMSMMPKPVSVDTRKTTAEEDEEYQERVRRDRVNPERAAQAQKIMAELGIRKIGGEDESFNIKRERN